MNRRNVGMMECWNVGMLGLITFSIIPTFHLSAQEPFPARAPAPARLRPVRFPPFRDVALPNGMTLLLVENHEQPTLSVSLSFRACTAYDPAGNVAGRAFQKEIYGRHPYGRNTSAAAYRAITRNDVAGFAGRRIRPAGSLLVISGDITLPRAQELATQAFGTWRGAAAPAPAFPAAPAKRRTDILLVNRPGSVQSNIVIGNTTFLPTDTIYYPARIATHVLGGGSDSRLFMILREQKSWTYGSYAALRRSRGLGYWQATFEGRTEVTDTALTELLH